MSTAFNVDFVKMNQTVFEHMRFVYGCGIDSPIGNQTLFECTKDASNRLKSKSADEIKTTRNDYWKKFMNALSNEVEPDKFAKIEYFFRAVSDPNIENTSEGVITLVSIQFFSTLRIIRNYQIFEI